jgi:hypothetical protein
VSLLSSELSVVRALQASVEGRLNEARERLARSDARALDEAACLGLRLDVLERDREGASLLALEHHQLEAKHAALGARVEGLEKAIKTLREAFEAERLVAREAMQAAMKETEDYRKREGEGQLAKQREVRPSCIYAYMHCILEKH